MMKFASCIDFRARIFASKGKFTDMNQRWTFLTNHSHVLFSLYRNPEITLREVAQEVGITERAVQKLVSELEEEGYIVKQKVGRRNQYTLDLSKSLRHDLERHTTIASILGVLVGDMER